MKIAVRRDFRRHESSALHLELHVCSDEVAAADAVCDPDVNCVVLARANDASYDRTVGLRWVARMVELLPGDVGSNVLVGIQVPFVALHFPSVLSKDPQSSLDESF